VNAPIIAARPALLGTRPGVRSVTVWLSAGLIVLGLLFHLEIAAAVTVWISSTAYNHCFLVLPIVAYLVWDRRETLRGMRPVPVPLAALAGIPVALVWLAAERLGIMEGRQLAAISFVELLFLAVLGWRLSWALAGPLLYLYFLVPFGDFLTPSLQDFTTYFVRVGLNLLNIPVFIDGYTIEIPQGSFYIAEACAGLRFLIASIAFGALYALVMYRSPLRRSLFLLASLAVPVIANGLRALGIVVLGNILGSAQAAATDHVLYGWLFFSIVIVILIALGLPFREDQKRADPAPNRAESHGRMPHPHILRAAVLAVAAVCLVAAISPAVATVLHPRSDMIQAAASPLDFGPGCTAAPDSPRTPLRDIRSGTRRIVCDGLVLQVKMVVLSPRVTAAPLFAREREMSASLQSEEGIQSSWIPAAAGQPRTWRLLSNPELSSAMAAAMWVDGQPTQPGMSVRRHLAWTSLMGARVAPVLITVTPEVDWSQLTVEKRRDVEHRLAKVLQGWPDMTIQVRRIAART